MVMKYIYEHESVYPNHKCVMNARIELRYSDDNINKIMEQISLLFDDLDEYVFLRQNDKENK